VQSLLVCTRQVAAHGWKLHVLAGGSTPNLPFPWVVRDPHLTQYVSRHQKCTCQMAFKYVKRFKQGVYERDRRQTDRQRYGWMWINKLSRIACTNNTQLQLMMMMMMMMWQGSMPLDGRRVSSSLHNQCTAGDVVGWWLGSGAGFSGRNVMWCLEPRVVRHITLILRASERHSRALELSFQRYALYKFMFYLLTCLLTRVAVWLSW